MLFRVLLSSFLILTNYLTLPAPVHKFYVSVCTIHHNSTDNRLELTFKLFTDDIESALNKHFGIESKFGTPKEIAHADSLLVDYFQLAFSVDVNDKPLFLNYIGREIELDATWCYFEVPKVRKIKKVTIRNLLLTNIAESQSNIVHIEYGSQTKSMLLGLIKPSAIVEF